MLCLQGQIHAGADVDGSKQGCPRVTAPTWASEIFIQKPDVVERYYEDSAGHNTVYGKLHCKLESSATIPVRSTTQ